MWKNKILYINLKIRHLYPIFHQFHQNHSHRFKNHYCSCPLVYPHIHPIHKKNSLSSKNVHKLYGNLLLLMPIIQWCCSLCYIVCNDSTYILPAKWRHYCWFWFHSNFLFWLDHSWVILRSFPIAPSFKIDSVNIIWFTYSHSPSTTYIALINNII